MRLRHGLVAALVWALLAAPAIALCRDDVVTLRGDFGEARFTVEVADTPETRGRGLMFREAMARLAGMFFVYDAPGRAMFWMRNTLMPLDMLFADETGRITHIHENAVPLDETTIDGGDGVLAVLEINGGLASELGITVGGEMQHPAFAAETAAWPCAER